MVMKTVCRLSVATRLLRFNWATTHSTFVFRMGKSHQRSIEKKNEVIEALENFKNAFEVVEAPETKYVNCGLFGYLAYDSVRYFEDVNVELPQPLIPDSIYKLYKYVIVVDHFSNELSLFRHCAGRFKRGCWRGPSENGADHFQQSVRNIQVFTRQRRRV